MNYYKLRIANLDPSHQKDLSNLGRMIVSSIPAYLLGDEGHYYTPAETIIFIKSPLSLADAGRIVEISEQVIKEQYGDITKWDVSVGE